MEGGKESVGGRKGECGREKRIVWEGGKDVRRASGSLVLSVIYLDLDFIRTLE